ncbi:MAG: methyltransferase domain-containing protein [Dehalococcoidia bacterium]|nr:methyltransferase domain-containing protein [Dehalococcoidia bacterium]
MTETQDSTDLERTASESLMQSYDAWEQVEDQVNEILDQSLNPRGYDMLYDLVAELGLPAGARALDVGCGRGPHAIHLAESFQMKVLGIDPVPYAIEAARKKLIERAGSNPGLAELVQFEVGWAEALPAEDGSVDLIWCRDVLELVPDLKAAYQEFHRVLKPDGWALVYQMFASDPELRPPDVQAENVEPEYAEAAMKAAGLQIEKCIEVGSEFGEYAQEQTGIAGRMLMHAARLLRAPDRYIEQFGKDNYDIALGDAYWHVYRLLGKINYRIYLLRAS